jgi:predicted HTH transcriptional regulator
MAAIAGLVSPMNGSIIKEEFEAFMLELNKFTQNFETNKNFSVKSIFTSSDLVSLNNSNHQLDGFSKPEFLSIESKSVKSVTESVVKNGGGLKRKDQRKNTILSFIKGHNNSSIKDIVPNIIGCSEKTIQRELIELIKEGKIKKTGERRWSKYSIA